MRITKGKGGSGLKEVERAYLAGLFDGEGCASVTYGQFVRVGSQRVYPNRHVQFVISNTDNRVLKEIRFLFGKGGIYSKKSFRITNPREIIDAIELIRPYIRVKKADLSNLYDASKYMLESRGSLKRHEWTEEERTTFLKFAETSKALKGGGKRGRPRTHPLK